MEIIPSRIALVISMEASCVSPSCRAPTTAIAPTQITSAFVTKPSTNLSSWLLTIFCKRCASPSMRSSSRSSSPRIAPMPSEQIKSRVPSVSSWFPSTCIIAPSAPVIPINKVQSPNACISRFRIRTGSPPFTSMPIAPPIMTAAALISVPITCLPFFPTNVPPRKQKVNNDNG